MKRKTFLKALVASAAVALVPLKAAAQDPIIVGEINHYKRMAAFAEPYKMGMELALEEVNADGGINGRPLEIIFRDDQGEPGEAVKIAEELMTRDGAVMLTGTILSNVGLAISSFAGEKGYVYLASEPLADSLVWAAITSAVVKPAVLGWVGEPGGGNILDFTELALGVGLMGIALHGFANVFSDAVTLKEDNDQFI